MATPDPEARAAALATAALELLDSSRQDEAVRSLRQALSLAPQNTTVISALDTFQKSAGVPRLSKLIHSLAVSNETKAGEEALKLLRDPGTTLQTSTAVEGIELLLSRVDDVPKPPSGKVVAETLRVSRGAREHVADRLSEEGTAPVTARFEKLGDDAVDALVTVSLDAMAWKKTENQLRTLRELLKRFLSAPSNVRAASRLLAARAADLHSDVNTAGFEELLRGLDLKNPQALRSHATLATAKFLEASGDTAASMLAKFVSSRLAADEDTDLRQAFSVAAAVFPLVPNVAASLFLTEGFVEALVASLDGRPTDVEEAALEMLSAACLEKTCRASIKTNCGDYLEALVKGEDCHAKSLAAVILAKIKYGAAEAGKLGQGMDELATTFRAMILQDEARDASIEGLAYASLKGSVKAALVKDKAFVDRLFDTLRSAASSSASSSTFSTPASQTTLFGALTILQNLTAYPPTLTEEQKKVAQLKNYADSKPTASLQPDVEDREPAVTSRCKLLLDAGLVPLLASLIRRLTPSAILLTSQLLRSLSKTQKHRGAIAAQGGLKTLLTFYAASLDSDTATDRSIRVVSAHALAQILVSVNPAHVFSSSTLPPTTAVRPLLHLLETPPDDGDLLPVFESLLALTNLASADDATRDLIIRLAWNKLEELLLAPNALVARAAVELVCNLQASPAGVAKFADGSSAARNRLHVLLALADAEDLATRRAAGGALAMLTDWTEARRAVMARGNAVERVLGMVQEEDEGVRHRGLVVLRNLVCPEEEGGEAEGQGDARVREKERAEWVGRFVHGGATEVVRDALRGTRSPEVLAVGVDALKVLMGAGEKVTA